MDIYYTNNTLYVNLENRVDIDSITTLRSKLFSILNDYDIESIVLKLVTNEKNELIDEFIREYNKKYHGNIIVK